MTHTYYIDTNCIISDGNMACVAGTTMSFANASEMQKSLTASDPDATFEKIEEPEYVTENMINW
ncbi:MAG: hypothetical protein RSE54_10580 [Ruthenibacterium sp.]